MLIYFIFKAKAYLSKLSKLANLGRIEDNPVPTTPTGNPYSQQDPVSAFIISPNTQAKPDGYLLYLQLAKTPKQAGYKWNGSTISLYASIPVRNSLYKHKSTLNSISSTKLILVTPKQSILNEKRVDIKQKLKGINMLLYMIEISI